MPELPRLPEFSSSNFISQKGVLEQGHPSPILDATLVLEPRQVSDEFRKAKKLKHHGKDGEKDIYRSTAHCYLFCSTAAEIRWSRMTDLSQWRDEMHLLREADNIWG